jgi:hypothetical protein
MKTYTAPVLAEVIEKHGKWLRDEDGGELADLRGADLSWANLREANLSGANLSWANLFNSNLSGANLSGANLSGANLSWANLFNSNLSGANLSGANLSGANLSEADLSWANLSGANLSGADLSGAKLLEADLINANLSGANLSWANLSEADLSWANLSGAKLSGAKNQIYIGQRSDGYQFFARHDKEKSAWIISAGCRYFTPDEYRAHTEKYNCGTKRAETLAMIDFAEIQIKIRGVVEVGNE